MATFIFDESLATRIKHVTATHAKTAREIAKELRVDKHIINQHLYKMAAERGEVNRVPTWWFPPQKDDDDDDDPVCEQCGYTDGWGVIVHSFGCVALCGKCSDIDEQPHCPRTHRDHEHDPCEDCVAGWAWIDEHDPITYNGTIIGYSKPGKVGIIKFSQRHQ
jgi:hypothetical protein